MAEIEQAVGVVMMRECKRCGQYKRASCFSRCKHGKDGLHSYCKSCRSEYMTAYHRRKRTSPPRKKAPNRAVIWPRSQTEALLDLNLRNWRYSVSAGQLTWRV